MMSGLGIASRGAMKGVVETPGIEALAKYSSLTFPAGMPPKRTQVLGPTQHQRYALVQPRHVHRALIYQGPGQLRLYQD